MLIFYPSDVDEEDFPLPEELTEAEVSFGSGYSESKWISEKLLEMAASKSDLRTVVVRVGQLSGGENGAWNESDWLPSIVRSAPYVKCLPLSDEASFQLGVLSKKIEN